MFRFDLPRCPQCGEPPAGTLETVPGLAELVEVGDGLFEYGGDTRIDWDSQRQLFWMLLDANDLIKAKPDMVHISTADDVTLRRALPTVSNTTPPRRNAPVSKPSQQTVEAHVPVESVSTKTSTNASNNTSPIHQATALLTSLNDAARATRELIRSLRRQKKQSQLVQSTLASLKQLKEVA